MSRSQALVEAQEVTLLDLVDRAVDHGVILTGDITIAVADIDLIYVGLQVLLASVERVQQLRVERERAVGQQKPTGYPADHSEDHPALAADIWRRLQDKRPMSGRP
jgi:gas vesicle structural protein